MRFVSFSLVLLAHLAMAAHCQAQSPKVPNVDLHGDELPDKALVRLGTTRFQPFEQYRRTSALLPDGRVATATGHTKEGIRFLQIDFMDTSSGKIVRTLEWIGTPAARDLLRTLADGIPRASLTIEARAALKRLDD